VGIYRLGLRLNMRRFFTVMGSALMLVAAGLLADAVQNLQQLGVLPGASATLWDTSRVLSDDSNLGDVLHGLFGYAASPSVLQITVWALFLAIGLRLFLAPPATPRSPLSAGTPSGSRARGA
jgi:high-affinity iron transporter